MAAITVTESASAPIRSPLLVVLISWLVPGGGHFMLGKRRRGGLIFLAVLVTFLIGVLMHGPLFQPSGGADVLSKLIQYGGFLGDLAVGAPYLIASFFGYAPPDVAGHVPDYGSKLIVAAGLLNILAIVDAYEITTRQKD